MGTTGERRVSHGNACGVMLIPNRKLFAYKVAHTGRIIEDDNFTRSAKRVYENLPCSWLQAPLRDNNYLSVTRR